MTEAEQSKTTDEIAGTDASTSTGTETVATPANAEAATAGAEPAGAATAGAATAGPAPGAEAGVSKTSDIVPGPGGVMTDEVGVVTGDLTLRTELTGGEVVLHVQYKDAEEWYVVTGGRSTLADPTDVEAVHTIAVALLHRPEG